MLTVSLVIAHLENGHIPCLMVLISGIKKHYTILTKLSIPSRNFVHFECNKNIYPDTLSYCDTN